MKYQSKTSQHWAERDFPCCICNRTIPSRVVFWLLESLEDDGDDNDYGICTDCHRELITKLALDGKAKQA